MYAMVPYNPYLPKTATNPYLVGGLGGAGLGLGSGLLWYYLTDQAKRNALTQILLPTLGGAGVGLAGAGLYDWGYGRGAASRDDDVAAAQNMALLLAKARTNPESLDLAERLWLGLTVDAPYAAGEHFGRFVSNPVDYVQNTLVPGVTSGAKAVAGGINSTLDYLKSLEAQREKVLQWAYDKAPDLIHRGLEGEFMEQPYGPLYQEALERMKRDIPPVASEPSNSSSARP